MQFTGLFLHPKCPAAMQYALRFIKRHQRELLLLWDIFMFSVVGLNSFILLLHRHREHSSLKYVICAGAVAYLFVLLFQTIYLRQKANRRHIFLTTKRIFRLIYTAIYLTAIMLDILAIAEMPGKEYQISYNGFLFIWVALWGTNFLWLGQLYQLLKKTVGNLQQRLTEKYD